MPNKDNNTIEFNQKDHGNSPFVIYADLECLLEKISTCYNNPKESSTTEINEHTPSGYSLFTNCSFDKTKNKLDCYRGEDCMKEFCKDLRKYTTKIINCNKKEVIPKEILVVFHNGSTYDYHFTIKKLVKEFDGKFECLGENTEKYITFSVTLKKKIKNFEITCKIKFIDSFRFMSTSLSKLVDNLSEGNHNNACVDCNSCFDYTKIKDEKLIFRCFTCKNMVITCLKDSN